MQKIIGEYNLNLIQKIHLFIVLLVLIVFYSVGNNNYSLIKTHLPLASIFLAIFTLLILATIFSSSGLIIKSHKLFKGYFVLGFLIYKQSIDLKSKTTLSILKLKRAHGMPAPGIIFPQNTHSFYKFYIYLLNKSHTEKTELIGFKKKENAEKIIAFLSKNLNLKYEIYSPDFSYKK